MEFWFGFNDDNVGNGFVNMEIVFGWMNMSFLYVEGLGMIFCFGGLEIEEMYVENGYFWFDI